MLLFIGLLFRGILKLKQHIGCMRFLCSSIFQTDGTRQTAAAHGAARQTRVRPDRGRAQVKKQVGRHRDAPVHLSGVQRGVLLGPQLLRLQLRAVHTRRTEGAAQGAAGAHAARGGRHSGWQTGGRWSREAGQTGRRPAEESEAETTCAQQESSQEEQVVMGMLCNAPN